MKFIIILSVIALYGVAAAFASSTADVAVEPGTKDPLELPAPPPMHPLARAKRVTCDVGAFACNLHCQWKGYAKGSCSSNVCHCSGYSG